MMRYIDAHNHLQDGRLDPCRAGVTENLMVVNGTSEADWQKVLELAQAHDWIVPALGLHPWYVRERSDRWETLLEQAPSAMGEIGLDRWIENPDLEAQEAVFVRQLEIAAERNVPATIHCLRAWGWMLEVLQKTRLPECGFLLHSYGGPTEMVTAFVDLGGYFSISGYYANKKKAKQRDVFRTIPRDRLLIETDAPDMLLPEEMDVFQIRDERGERLNHPGNIKAVYRFASELLEMSEEALATQVETNFRGLFGTVLKQL